MERHIVLDSRFSMCPHCGGYGKKHSKGKRIVHEIGLEKTDLVITYTKYRCSYCKKYFSIKMDHLVESKSRYSNRVKRLAMFIKSRGVTLNNVSKIMKNKYNVKIPIQTLHEWCVTTDL